LATCSKLSAASSTPMVVAGVAVGLVAALADEAVVAGVAQRDSRVA
jgi:hypothetical protein